RPETPANREMLVRHVVAQVMVWKLHAQIGAGAGVGGSDDVPARSPLAEMIQSGELTRRHIRRGEGRRYSGSQSDPLGHGTDLRQRQERVQGGRTGFDAVLIGFS